MVQSSSIKYRQQHSTTTNVVESKFQVETKTTTNVRKPPIISLFGRKTPSFGSLGPESRNDIDDFQISPKALSSRWTPSPPNSSVSQPSFQNDAAEKWLGDMGQEDTSQHNLYLPDSPTDVKDDKLVQESLRHIAQRLTLDKPRALSIKEEQQLTNMGHRITLGENMAESVTEKNKKVLKKIFRNSGLGKTPQILSAEDVANDNSLTKMGEKFHKHTNKFRRHTAPTKSLSSSPKGSPCSSLDTVQHARGSSGRRRSTLGEEAVREPTSLLTFNNTSTSTTKIQSTTQESSTTTTTSKKNPFLRRHSQEKPIMNTPKSNDEHGNPMDALEIPSLKPLTGFLTHSEDMPMRSSEHDPSPHQVELPPCHELLMHSKLCALFDQYRAIDQNFDFGSLVKVTREEFLDFVRSNSVKSHTNHKSSPSKSRLSDQLIKQHVPIVKSYLDCCESELLLEGFFHSTLVDSNDRVEVAVFNCQVRRTFVVVYRNATDNFGWPFRTSKQAKTTMLHTDQKVAVSSSVKSAYFGGPPYLEGRVFELLDQLSEQYPFCDVIMTGHSFGGALATIASLRYAISRAMIRVSCHVFGCARLGGPDFRLLVNSLQNLKVIRVEYNEDGRVINQDSSAGDWTHVGHTLALQPKCKPPSVAYRFEKHKPTLAKHKFLPLRKGEKTAQNISAFVIAIRQYADGRFAWMTDFEGAVGKGVRGTNDETREVV